MKKKWKTATLAVAGVALVGNPYTLNLLGLESIANMLYYSEDDALYDQQLTGAKEAIDKAKLTSLEVDVKKAIDTVIAVPWANGYKFEEKDKLLDELFFWIDDLSDDDSKAKYAVYFVDKSINRVTESLIQPDYELAYALVFELPDGKMKDRYMTILEETDKKMGKQLLEAIKNGSIEIPEHGFDWGRLPPEAFEKYEPEDTGNILPGYDYPDKETPKPHPDALPEEDYTLKHRYETVGAHCYRVTTKTVEGKKPTVTRDLLTGNDATFCSVLIVDSKDGHNGTETPYDFSKVQPSPAGSGMNLNGGVSDNSSYAGTIGNNGSQGVANASNLTLQYTLDRTESEPYFYETDMIVSKDGTITYQQQRDVLFQLAIRSGGKAVEDKDRFLVLLENKIIVVQNQGDKIPVSSFNLILKDFKAQVKAMERTTGTE